MCCFLLGINNILRFSILVFSLASVAAIIRYIPAEWEGKCTAKWDSDILGLYEDHMSDVMPIVKIQCIVVEENNFHWRFETLRDFTRSWLGIQFFVELQCEGSANISLPWPMKAKNVVGLKIRNCLLTDRYKDFNHKNVLRIPDSLRVLEIKDSAWYTDLLVFDSITTQESLSSLTSDYDCGHDSTIVRLVTRNVSYFTPDAKQSSYLQSDVYEPQIGNFSLNLKSINSSFQEVKNGVFVSNQTNSTSKDIDSYAILLQNIQSLDVICEFKRLELYEDSISQFQPIHYFSVMIQDASYPQLQTMNVSNNGIKYISMELQNFRKNFPKLRYLDLSNNFIKQATFPQAEGYRKQLLTVDLRLNNITELTLFNVTEWSQHSDVFIDLRDNPLHCGCQMISLIYHIQSRNFFTGRKSKYDYIKSLKCHTPENLKGEMLMNVQVTECLHQVNFESYYKKQDKLDFLRIRLALGLALLALTMVVAIGVVIYKAIWKEKELPTELKHEMNSSL